LDDHTRRVAGYHLGWLDQGGRPVDGPEGKALRPVLALLSAQAAGASVEVGLPGAVAVELVHNFSLIHDDLMDRDTERHHRPTVWSVWGDAMAVLVGDALLSLAHEVLDDSGSAYAVPGGRAWAQREARARIGCAIEAIDGLGLDPAHRSELAHLATFVVERDL
jgi:geranylgeranyl diphosphate synthase type I